MTWGRGVVWYERTRRASWRCQRRPLLLPVKTKVNITVNQTAHIIYNKIREKKLPTRARLESKIDFQTVMPDVRIFKENHISQTESSLTSQKVPIQSPTHQSNSF